MIKKLILPVFIFMLTALAIFSCEKKTKKENNYKEIEYKVNTMLYNKKYENTIKYIDSVYFSEKSNITEKQKIKLQFKQAEIKYLYLNDSAKAYKEMKKIFKIKDLDKNLKLKLLTYLVSISENVDNNNYGVFLEKLIEANASINSEANKEVLYKYIDFLKKKKDIIKLSKILKKNKLFSKDELILLNLNLLIMKKSSKEIIFTFIEKNKSETKSQKIIDKLNIETIFYLEQQEKIDYQQLLDLLKLIKSENYTEFKKSKEIFYKNKISLYNKK